MIDNLKDTYNLSINNLLASFLIHFIINFKQFLKIFNCKIRNCSALTGGGINLNQATANIKNVEISNCKAYGVDWSAGGAICSQQSSVYIYNLFANNDSARYCGGLYNYTNCKSVVENSIFINNKSKTGGGALHITINSSLILKNSLLVNNFSNDGGAAMDIDSSIVQWTNVTCVNNINNKNLGINSYRHPIFNVINSIIWNTPFNIPSNIKYSNVQGGWSGIGNINSIPQFVNPVSDFHLLSTSPCMNAGSPDTSGLNLPSIDLDGNYRIKNNRIDIGAYEFDISLSSNIITMSNVKIFPNPAKGIFYIDCSELKDKAKIEITNVLGQNIYSAILLLDTKMKMIDLSNQNKGIYFIQIQSGNEKIVRKILNY